MARNQVRVKHDVKIDYYGNGSDFLHLQWCRFDLGERELWGYRFMWSRDGALRPLRGGARIPSMEAMKTLMSMADAEGWGGLEEHKQSELA